MSTSAAEYSTWHDIDKWRAYGIIYAETRSRTTEVEMRIKLYVLAVAFLLVLI
jgi:hypothetical protein